MLVLPFLILCTLLKLISKNVLLPILSKRIIPCYVLMHVPNGLSKVFHVIATYVLIILSLLSVLMFSCTFSFLFLHVYVHYSLPPRTAVASVIRT